MLAEMCKVKHSALEVSFKTYLRTTKISATLDDDPYCTRATKNEVQ